MKRGITFQVYMFGMEELTEMCVEQLSSLSRREFIVNLKFSLS